MTRSKTFAYRCRFALLLLGLACFAFGVWLLFLHPGVESTALGWGLDGTPLVLVYLLDGVIPVRFGGPCVFLGLFLLSQWLFLWPRRGWTVRLTQKGRPKWESVLTASFMVTLLSAGFVATLLEIPDLWGNACRSFGIWGIWAAMATLWMAWACVFFLYWRGGDEYARLTGMIRGLIAGSVLEMLIAAPVHAWVVSRRSSDCYCNRGSYTGLVFGLTVLLWAFGPGLVLLFLHEKHRRAKLLAGLCPRCGKDLVSLEAEAPFCPNCVFASRDEVPRRAAAPSDSVRGNDWREQTVARGQQQD